MKIFTFQFFYPKIGKSVREKNLYFFETDYNMIRSRSVHGEFL